MNAVTLDANFYRERANLCHRLANAATEAKPLFARLYFLAKAYEERAQAHDPAGGQTTENSSSHNRPTSLAVTAS